MKTAIVYDNIVPNDVFDVRLAGLKSNLGGTLEPGALTMVTPTFLTTTTCSPASEDGWLFTVEHTQSMMKGFNKFVLQYGTDSMTSNGKGIPQGGSAITMAPCGVC